MEKPDFPAVITNTIREAFSQCPQKGYWGHIKNIVPDVPSIHLHAGGAFAKSMEVARRSFFQLGMNEADSISAGHAALIEFYGDFDAEYGYLDHAKSCANMLRAYEDYFMEYQLNHDSLTPIMTADGQAALEFSFSIPMNILHPTTGDPLLYAGKFDMLGKRPDGSLWVVDEKTTGQLGAQWSKQWDLNSQFTGYCMAAREYGYPVQGAIIRGVGLLKTKISHQQVPLTRPQWIIDRWWTQLHRDVERVKQLWLEDNGDGSNFDLALGAACSSYGGCGYKTLCMSPNPHEWTAVGFKPSDYNPTGQSGEE